VSGCAPHDCTPASRFRPYLRQQCRCLSTCPRAHQLVQHRIRPASLRSAPAARISVRDSHHAAAPSSNPGGRSLHLTRWRRAVSHATHDSARRTAWKRIVGGRCRDLQLFPGFVIQGRRTSLPSAPDHHGTIRSAPSPSGKPRSRPQSSKRRQAKSSGGRQGNPPREHRNPPRPRRRRNPAGLRLVIYHKGLEFHIGLSRF